MGLQDQDVLESADKFDNNLSFLYLISLLCSFGCSLGITYCLKHKTHLNKKFDVWKCFAKFPSYRSVLATSLVAVTAAFVGGLCNATDGGIFVRASFCAVPAGVLAAMLSGSPILFATSAIFTFTGILQSPVCLESMVVNKDCLNNTDAFGSFDWFLGTPSPSWTEDSKWSHDMLDLTLRGLMWTIPLGLPIRSYSYSSLVSFSGLAMGIAYSVGSANSVPFPLCLMGVLPGMSLGNFYMGAWMFFAITICVLGSKHPLPPTQTNEHTSQETTSPAMPTKAPSTIVEMRTHESDKLFMKTRVVDTDTETDEEPLVMATVVGQPVSKLSPTPAPSSQTNTQKRGRCGRPVHGSKAMQCCWAMHVFLSIFLICAAVFVLSIWLDYSPEAVIASDEDNAEDNTDDWFVGWDSWYVWFLIAFLLTFSYRRPRERRGCSCCRRRNLSGSPTF